MMKTLKAKLTGVAPLMMHNERLCNKRDPGTKRLSELATQRKKSDEVLDQVSELEWRLSFYEQAGMPVLPAANLLASLKEGGRKRKLGKQAQAAVFSTILFFPL